MIPFAAGILTGVKLPGTMSGLPLVILAVLLLFLYYTNDAVRNDRRFVWLIVSDICLFLSALAMVNASRLPERSAFYSNYVQTDSLVTCIAEINDIPVEKNRFVKCLLKVRQLKTDSGYRPAIGNILAYVRKPNAIGSLDAGRCVVIKSKWLEPAPPKNPYEFDYKNFLASKQIYHTTFVDSLAYRFIEIERPAHSLWRWGLYIKARVLLRLKSSELTPLAYAICAALLTGFDDDIDKSTMEAFSHSGTLHVLSVSGLHTGLIYLTLNFLLGMVDRKGSMKLFRFFVITVSLWFFALITGFSAPVLRAVIMFNLFGIGKIFFRNSSGNQTNILLVSAFLLLCYDPFLIADLGFLLSYFALFGIIAFQPPLAGMFRPRNYFLNYAWQSISASFAATISTLPITLFYFKQFAIWFFVCNVVVVPATFLVLLLSVFVVLKINFFAIVINFTIAFLVRFIQAFNSDGMGYVDGIDFSATDAWMLSLLIIFVAYAFKSREHRIMVFVLAVLISWQSLSMVQSFIVKTSSLVSVYSIKHKTALSVKNNTDLYVSDFDNISYNYSIRPHVLSFNYAHLIKRRFNFFVKGTSVFLVLNTPGYWPATDLSKATHLLVSNNFRLTEADLALCKDLKMIVTDGSNNNYTIKKTEELSRKFGVAFYDTKAEGALLLQLK